MPDSATAVRLHAGDAELTVLPTEGCRVVGFRVGGTELLRTEPVGEDDYRIFSYGSFPMAPWAGRVDRGRWNNGPFRHQLPVDAPPHAIHGTAIRSRWSAAGPATASSAAFFTDLARPWPYPGRITQIFELTERSLRTTLAVEASLDSFPAQVGWHPWFRRRLRPDGPEADLEFAPAWQEERGRDHLPTGRRVRPTEGPWDDCFGMPDGVEATLRWGDEFALTVSADCTYVVVYDAQADALCVEPQTGPPNGLNTHPHLVTPIDPLEATMTWTW
ncbi:aldose 1-epimerase [Streptacidiphilus monticola]|uniref:Aldose 1-epimerase n=1 Tax=Streptacidiphilus monticola TaxID=2161674 RepID=A0ABW1G739_9ACTN